MLGCDQIIDFNFPTIEKIDDYIQRICEIIQSNDDEKSIVSKLKNNLLVWDYAPDEIRILYAKFLAVALELKKPIVFDFLKKEVPVKFDLQDVLLEISRIEIAKQFVSDHKIDLSLVGGDLLKKALQNKKYACINTLISIMTIDKRVLEHALLTTIWNKEIYLVLSVLKHAMRRNKKLTPSLELEINKMFPGVVFFRADEQKIDISNAVTVKAKTNLRQFTNPIDPARKALLPKVQKEIKEQGIVASIKHGYYDRGVEFKNRKLKEVIFDAIDELIKEDNPEAIENIRNEFKLEFHDHYHHFMTAVLDYKKINCFIYIFPFCNSYGSVDSAYLKKFIIQLMNDDNVKDLDQLFKAFVIPFHTMKMDFQLDEYEFKENNLPLVAFAAFLGKKQILNYLLQTHDVNSMYSNGLTALACALLKGHYQLIPTLINAGADPLVNVNAKLSFKGNRTGASYFINNYNFSFDEKIKPHSLVDLFGEDADKKAGIQALIGQGIFARQKQVALHLYSQNIINVKEIASLISEYEVGEEVGPSSP